MSYHVSIEKSVLKQLAKVPEPDYSRIKSAILSLARNPRPAGCKKLKGRSAYRIRQGNYRVIYEVGDQQLRVLVVAVGNRRDVYR